MRLKYLSDHQRWTIIDALHTAAEQYGEDALRIYANPRVTEQFKIRCREARELPIWSHRLRISSFISTGRDVCMSGYGSLRHPGIAFAK